MHDRVKRTLPYLPVFKVDLKSLEDTLTWKNPLLSKLTVIVFTAASDKTRPGVYVLSWNVLIKYPRPLSCMANFYSEEGQWQAGTNISPLAQKMSYRKQAQHYVVHLHAFFYHDCRKQTRSFKQFQSSSQSSKVEPCKNMFNRWCSFNKIESDINYSILLQHRWCYKSTHLVRHAPKQMYLFIKRDTLSTDREGKYNESPLDSPVFISQHSSARRFNSSPFQLRFPTFC